VTGLRSAVSSHGPHSADKVIDSQALLAQFRRIEDTLRPVVGAAAEQRAGGTLLANQMVQIIELLEQLGARIGDPRRHPHE
jgi:hypothetical protein